MQLNTFSKPGSNKRVCAFLIDLLIAHEIAYLASFLMGNLSGVLSPLYIVFKDSRNGQGIGKLIVGIKVFDQTQKQANLKQTIIRNIFMVIPFFMIFEYFFMICNKDGKRIGDRAMRTFVGDLKPQLKDSTFLLISIFILALIVIAKRMGLSS
jgi:uncharacterized RDD family membrane protein YckC